MSDLVKVEYLNDVNMRVTADPSIREELREFFSFRPENYKFVPSFKNKMWDGWIRIYQPMAPLLYVGLLPYLIKFCKDREYEMDIDTQLTELEVVEDNYAYDFAKHIKSPYEPRDYQNEYVTHCIKHKRALLISPTSSGKSYIIHLLQQHYYRMSKLRTLVVVPTVSLVHQMAGDFVDYGVDEKHIHKIKSGAEKETDCAVVISTWQSLVRMPHEWFQQFDVFVGDEAHNFKAKSLTTIMSNLTDCKYKFGFTGTVSSKSPVNKLVLEGLFGGYKKFVSTKELIEDGTVATFKVKALILNHTKETKKELKKANKGPDGKSLAGNKKYTNEVNYINNNDKRNLFIRNLLWSLKGQNNLILFDRIENHGDILRPILDNPEIAVLHYVHGGVKGEVREDIRKLVENDPIKQHNILASYGVFSTGINLKKLDNVIFASSSKSEIKVLQSIGRVLRKGNGADDATLYDITDILTTTQKANYTLEHFKERIEIYSSEQFDFKIYNVDL